MANKEEDLDKKYQQSYFDKFAKTHGFEKAFRTSAKENINVDEAFSALVEAILDRSTSTDPLNGEKVAYLSQNSGILGKKLSIPRKKSDKKKK